MRLFRASYKDKNGEKRIVKKWWIETRDHLGILRRFGAFQDRRASESLGRQIVKLVNCKAGGEVPDAGLTQWLESIPVKLSRRFAKIGLLDSRRLAAGVPLLDHLKDFREFLSAKGNTLRHVTKTVNRVRCVFEGCRFITWSDISASKTERYLAGLRDGEENLSILTTNYYRKAAKQFCRWMVQDRRASESPLDHLRGMNARTDIRRVRRALGADEVRRLLEAAEAEPERFNMTGHQRALLYRLAVESGLRAAELRSLTPSSFDLNACTVTIEAGYSKHRREDVLPLRLSTVEALRIYLSGKLPQTKIFDIPNRTADMLHSDLEAAGISYIDNSGRIADFHALRHTCGSLLASAGTHPKVMQSIMRHGDINLTMSRYSHTYQGQESDAIASLPDLTKPSRERQQAKQTGTDAVKVIPGHLSKTGQKNLAYNLAFLCGQQCNSVDHYGQTGGNSGKSKNAGECPKSTGKAVSATITEEKQNTPEGIRTSNLRFRRPMLYPIELRAHEIQLSVI